MGDLLYNGSVQENLFHKVSTIETETHAHDKYLNEWFHENALKELLIFKQFLNDYTYKNEKSLRFK